MVELDYNKSYRKGKIITDWITLERIRENFSQPINDINFVRERSGNDNIPDRKYVVQPTGMYDFGLSEELIEFLQEEDIEFSKTENFCYRFESGYSNEEVFDGLIYTNRYYGIETIKEALKKGRGTVLWATGAGKSFLQASLIENIWRNSKKPFKCLVIVPGLGLVSQLLENFEEYGVNFTYSGWTGGPEGLQLQNTEVVICNSENFCAKFDANRKWIKKIDLLFVDECHKISNGSVLSSKLQKIETVHRFGFTGTMPKDKIDEWKVIGTFGPVIYEKNSKELRDEGYLSDANIKLVKLNHNVYKSFSYRQEVSYIHKSPKRKIIIKNLVKKLEKNVLILVNSIKHGEDIVNTMSSLIGKECYFVYGEMPVEERMKIIEKMEAQDNIVCVAMSSIFSTGINIKNLHYIVFIEGGKSFIRTVQSIGRGLRLHESKNRLTLIDIYDNLRYSMEHADKRKEFYDEQQIEWKEIEISL